MSSAKFVEPTRDTLIELPTPYMSNEDVANMLNKMTADNGDLLEAYITFNKLWDSEEPDNERELLDWALKFKNPCLFVHLREMIALETVLDSEILESKFCRHFDQFRFLFKLLYTIDDTHRKATVAENERIAEYHKSLVKDEE